MGGLIGGLFGSKPKFQRDPEADRRRAEAEAQAKKEQEELKRKQAEEAEAIRRGLRGRRSLLSSAGGALGFPSTLGA